MRDREREKTEREGWKQRTGDNERKKDEKIKVGWRRWGIRLMNVT